MNTAAGDTEQVEASPFYANNPEWKDVVPIKFTNEELGAVLFDAFSYLRAVMQKREMSKRVFNLVEDCIRLNSSNYSVWQYRRELVKALNIDLSSEMRYISEVITENPKNYQVWHHRRYLVEEIGSDAVPQELVFTASIIREEPKNYHAWQHRHWILRKFFDYTNVTDEMNFAIKLCREDSRNNSAWNYHFALMERSSAFNDDELMETVITTCKLVIDSSPDNESIWNYLSGLFEEVSQEKKSCIIAFVEDLYERTEADKRSAYMMYNELELNNPVRKNYWKHMQVRSDNVFQKHLDVQVSLKDAKGLTLQVGLAKKTLWSWTIESLLEYHRIVSDLFFDEERLFRVAVSDSIGKLLQTTWDKSAISYSALTNSLAAVGVPTDTGEDAIPISGLALAVEALGQKTPQEEKSKDLKDKESALHNGGSIIVFCNLKSENELIELEKAVNDVVVLRNSKADILGSAQCLPVEKIDLYVINTYPRDEKPVVSSSLNKQISTILNCTVINSPAGERLISATHSVCLSIHDLVSTTVSGIPMKEEAQQGTSVNYDVELFHPRASHSILESLKLCGDDGFLQDKSRNLPYGTYKLSWSTPSPKNKWNLFPKTLSAVRVTPAAVNSRPSVCLTSFLLGGRNVMLEVKRAGPAESIKPNVNQKLISHTLISHNGRIYLHAIDILPNIPKLTSEDLSFKWPAITTDDCDSDDDDDEECELGFSPMVRIDDVIDDNEEAPEKIIADGTLRFDDMQHLMQECMLRPRLETDIIPEAIYRVLGLKTAKEALFKGQIKCSLIEDVKTKEEQYKIAFIELASYLGNYVNQSENHAELFKLLVDTLNLEQYVTINTDDVSVAYDDSFSTDSYVVEKMIPSASTMQSSRSSSPIPKKIKKSSYYNANESINIFELLCNLVPHPRIRPDFVGRVEAGKELAKLYKGIDFSNAPSKGQEVSM